MALGLGFRISEEVVSRVRCLLVHAQPSAVPAAGLSAQGVSRRCRDW